MSDRTQLSSFTLGLAGCSGNLKAQWFLDFSQLGFSATALPSRGSGAPIMIHFSKSAMTEAGSFSLGGIAVSSSS